MSLELTKKQEKLLSDISSRENVAYGLENAILGILSNKKEKDKKDKMSEKRQEIIALRMECEPLYTKLHNRVNSFEGSTFDSIMAILDLNDHICTVELLLTKKSLDEERYKNQWTDNRFYSICKFRSMEIQSHRAPILELLKILLGKDSKKENKGALTHKEHK